MFDLISKRTNKILSLLCSGFGAQTFEPLQASIIQINENKIEQRRQEKKKVKKQTCAVFHRSLFKFFFFWFLIIGTRILFVCAKENEMKM